MPPKSKPTTKTSTVSNKSTETKKPINHPIESKPSTSTNHAQSKLSKDERELFTRCVNAEQRTLSHEELQAAMPKLDVVEKMNVANSLIARGMLQVKRLQDELFYTAIDKTQQRANSNMTADEKLVYDSIASSGNTGMWTKTLKARTNIHQSNINKFLKSLESKNLIKSVKSVKFPTRKIYMLSELQPSIELSGGPWYTDNELDIEFITVLLRSIHQCLQDRSYPPVSSSSTDPLKVLLYPTSHTPYLPTTVHDVLAYLKQTQIIQEGTDLTPEHILTLLDVLVFDGVVERITVGTAKIEGEEEEFEEEEENHSDESEDQKPRHRSKSQLKKGKSTLPKKRSRPDDDLELDEDFKMRSIDDDDDEEDDLKPKTPSAASRRRRILPENEAFVYRVLQPLMKNQLNPEEEEEEAELKLEEEITNPNGSIELPPKLSGFFDMPCGHCPSFEFCSSKGKSWQFRGHPVLSRHSAIELERLPRNGLAGIGAGFSAIGGLGAAGGVAPVNPADCIYL
ncbi:RNA polymerase Rpc34 subunit-domain-containing protein [Melampsora americana]|nr:RNA polymerase Rpc34 subunit-domain-containing protein [Melampsora americana]